MSQKILLMFIMMGSSLLLINCAGVPLSNTQSSEAQPNVQDAYFSLSEAATSVSQSLTQLKATEQAANPPVSVSEPPSPSTYGMAMPASIEWNGPIQSLVNQIATLTNYQVRVVGNVPSLPILVNISEKDTPAGEILRDAGYQCGDRAQIVVFPSSNTIELRYARI